MTPTAGMTIAEIAAAISSIVTAAVSWISSYIGSITASGNTLLLFFVVFGFIGTGIGLIKRLVRIN